MRRFRFLKPRHWCIIVSSVIGITTVAFVVQPPPCLSTRTYTDTHTDTYTCTCTCLAASNYIHLDHIDRVFCISDLHTDHADNMQWLANHTLSDSPVSLSERDLVVVAGDISHEIDRIEQSLMYLLRTGASIVFVAGNHEGWLHSTDTERSSMDKLSQVYQTCRELGVYTQTCIKVGGTTERPYTLWLVPLESWYDGSLTLVECEDLCQDFGKWPWVDFLKCQWPGYESMPTPNDKIPQGLAEYFAKHLNQPLLERLPDWIENDNEAIMTISHFLPNQQCLPDWKDIESPIFRRDCWLTHGGGGISAKFAKVAGTNLIDKQIRSLDVPPSTRQFHVFGHSHRPKDFEWKGIRYIHNPLGKPREREIHMVSPQVDFQEVWRTTSGEVQGEQVIRYWEERGGGLEALLLRMNNSKKKSRYGKQLKKQETGSDYPNQQ